jgi:dihydrofolate synthase/folylpolyglutamate synthase
MNNYYKSIDKIYNLVNFELTGIATPSKEFRLDRMITACKLLGNPQKKIRTIHVAGTKGKGSISALIAAILQGCGYRVGLYTSPHINTLRERIQINFSAIDHCSLVDLVENVIPLLEKNMVNQKALTFFETMTLFSFLYFASNNVDFQVIETGLGGRLDATNVVDPCLTVITPISMDHTYLLGDTIESIALEKAGIIKTGVPLVVSLQQDKALEVLSKVADDKNVDLIETFSRVKITMIKEVFNGQNVEFVMDSNTFSCFLPLIGQHQIENLATALAAVNVAGVIVGKGLEKGMNILKLPGRIQTLKTKPCLLIVDVAHNPISMKRLSSTLTKSFNKYSPSIILGMTTGHDVDGVLEELATINPILFPVKHFHPKAVNPEDIVQKAISHGLKVCYNKTQNTIEPTLNKLLLGAKENDLILATGSFSVVGETMAVTGSHEVKENSYERQLSINKVVERRRVTSDNGWIQ